MVPPGPFIVPTLCWIQVHPFVCRFSKILAPSTAAAFAHGDKAILRGRGASSQMSWTVSFVPVASDRMA